MSSTEDALEAIFELEQGDLHRTSTYIQRDDVEREAWEHTFTPLIKFALTLTIAPATSQHRYRRVTFIGVDQYGQPVIEGITVPSSPQTKHYLAVKRKQHKQVFTPRLSCRRSSRRLAVQAKRKRLGMDIHGGHWAYQGWKRREILEIATCIGGFPE